VQALEALKAGNERYRDSRRLPAHGAQYSSQNYEDGIILEIFRRIGTKERTFVEIGIGDGTENNTATLLATGWRGWWVEGGQANCDRINDLIQSSTGAAGRLRVRQAHVTAENVSALFNELAIPSEVDLFSLDIDLNTYHIWKALKGFRPRVVVVEYNAGFPPDVEWVCPYQKDGLWDGSQVFGASLKAYERLGGEQGYALVGCDLVGANAFFVRQDLLGDKFVAPYTAENHYEPPRYGLVYRWAHPARLIL